MALLVNVHDNTNKVHWEWNQWNDKLSSWGVLMDGMIASTAGRLCGLFGYECRLTRVIPLFWHKPWAQARSLSIRLFQRGKQEHNVQSSREGSLGE